MEQDFIITGIHNVIYVKKESYEGRIIHLPNLLRHNELILHLSGSASVYFNKETLTTNANTIRFLPEGRNSEYIVERHEAGECIDIFFSTDKPVSDKAFVITPVNIEVIRMLFKRLFHIWVAKNEGYYFESISLLYKILSQMQKTHHLPQQQYNLVKQALDYIEQNFLTQSISMDDLASHCGISYSYLKKLFHQKIGMAPKEYIISMKINYACNLLRSGQYTVSESADICGYKDVFFFSRQFKEYIGVSPTEYRKEFISI